MTQAVPTEGFIAQPLNTIQAGVPNIPPQNMQPGFVQHPAGTPVPATQVQVPEPAKPNESVPVAGIEGAIAALQAALATQAPAPTTVQTSSLNSLDVSTIDDPILRSMSTVMQTIGKGIDMDRVFSKALEHGNAEFLDLAYLREKGGANSEQLVTIAQGIVQAVQAQAESTAREVQAIAGGEAGWTTAVTAFNSAAPPELRAVVAQMLDSGVKTQIHAGAKLIVQYSKASGLVPNTNPLLQSGAASIPAAQALSKNEFQDELRKLNPNARNYQQERNDLFARRQTGKNLGKN